MSNLTSPPYASPRYWLRQASIVIIGVLVALGVSYVGRRLNWPQPIWLRVAIVFFVVYALHADSPGRAPQGWISRVIHGLVAAAVGTTIYALLSRW